MLWLTKGVSIRLLARTAGRTWVRRCSGRTVRNSESLRGLRCTLQERRGLGKARALLGPLAVRTYRTWAKALSGPKPCGRADKSEGFVGSKAVRTSGQERRLCRVQSRADERTRAKALSGQSRADERTGAKALSGKSRADERTRAKALSCQSRADERTGAKALSGKSRADERTGQKAEAKMGVILALRR